MSSIIILNNNNNKNISRKLRFGELLLENNKKFVGREKNISQCTHRLCVCNGTGAFGMGEKYFIACWLRKYKLQRKLSSSSSLDILFSSSSSSVCYIYEFQCVIRYGGNVMQFHTKMEHNRKRTSKTTPNKFPLLYSGIEQNRNREKKSSKKKNENISTENHSISNIELLGVPPSPCNNALHCISHNKCFSVNRCDNYCKSLNTTKIKTPDTETEKKAYKINLT